MRSHTLRLLLASTLAVSACTRPGDAHLTLDTSALAARAALGGITLDRYELHVTAPDLAEPIIVQVDADATEIEVTLDAGSARRFRLVAERLIDTTSVPAFVGETTADLVPGSNQVSIDAFEVGLVRATVSVIEQVTLPNDFGVSIATEATVPGLTPSEPVPLVDGGFELALGVGAHTFTLPTFDSSGAVFGHAAPVTVDVAHADITTVRLFVIRAGTKCLDTQDPAVRDAAPVCRSISTTVSGLTEPGLVVRLTSSALVDSFELTLDGDGSRAFTTGLPEGAEYEVSIASTPANSICTLGPNELGAVTGDVVVPITCVPLTYTITVDARGITDPVTVSLSSGAAEVEITQDGFFVLASLPAGTAYNAAVSQPADPGRHCVLNGSARTLISDQTMVLVCMGEVLPEFPDLPNWNDRFDPSATPLGPCGVGPSGGECVHSGERRMVELPDITSCAGVSISDDLGAFEWACDDSVVPAVARSVRLNPDANLTNLVNFATATFHSNAVSVMDAEGVGRQTPATIWWSNPVTEITTVQPGSPGGIWLVTANTQITQALSPESNTAVLVDPQRAPWSVPFDNALRFLERNDLWIEGAFQGAGGGSGGVVSVASARSVVLRNVKVTDGDSLAIGLSGCDRCELHRVDASSTDGQGVDAFNIYDSLLTDITINDAVGGIFLLGDRNIVQHLWVSNDRAAPGNPTVEVTGVSNRLFDVRIANSGGTGLVIGGGAFDTVLSGVHVHNVGHHGIDLSGSEHTRLVDAVITNSGGGALYADSSYHPVIANVTLANSDTVYALMELGYVQSATVMNVGAVNGATGLRVGFSFDIELHSMAALAAAIGVEGYDDSVWRDALLFGQNTSMCATDGYALVDGMCTDTGAEGSNTYPNSSSDAVLSLDNDPATAFAGFVSGDGTNTTHDGTGGAPCGPSLDWVRFDNAYRSYTLDVAFPSLAHQGSIISGAACHIFDWRVADASDLRNAAPDPSTLTLSIHVVTNDATASVCADEFPGTTYNDFDATCEESYLASAVEIFGDGIGLDNVLCNPGDDCLVSRNIGAYQGEGALIPAGTVPLAEGDITLWRYADGVGTGDAASP